MTSRVFHTTIVVLLAWALMAPTLSEVACVDVCTGSACEDEVLIEFCETDSTDDCCSPAQSDGETVQLWNLGIPVIGDICSLCPCFEDDPIDICIVSKTPDLKRLTPVVVNTMRPIPISAPLLKNPYDVETLLVDTHGPPLYQKHHSLLL